MELQISLLKASSFPVVVFQSKNTRCLNLCKKRLSWSDHKYALRFTTLHDSHLEEWLKHLSLRIESHFDIPNRNYRALLLLSFS